jgi:hypothetical protein
VRIPPNHLLSPPNEESFPLSVKEMGIEIGFLKKHENG